MIVELVSESNRTFDDENGYIIIKTRKLNINDNEIDLNYTYSHLVSGFYLNRSINIIMKKGRHTILDIEARDQYVQLDTQNEIYRHKIRPYCEIKNITGKALDLFFIEKLIGESDSFFNPDEDNTMFTAIIAAIRYSRGRGMYLNITMSNDIIHRQIIKKWNYEHIQYVIDI